MKVIDSSETPPSRSLVRDDLEIRMALEFALQELRGPLSASSALLDDLRGELDLPRGRSDSFDALEGAVRSIAEQVEGLAPLGTSTVSKEVVDLAEVVRAVRTQRWAALSERGIRAHGLEGSIPIWANRDVIQRVLGTLVDDVVDQTAGLRNIWIRGFLADKNALLVIQNDGSGWLADSPERASARSLRFCAWALGRVGARLEIGRSISGDELVLTFPVVVYSESVASDESDAR